MDNTRLLKGGLDIPGVATVASVSLLLAWSQDRYTSALSRTGAKGSYDAINAAGLLV